MGRLEPILEVFCINTAHDEIFYIFFLKNLYIAHLVIILTDRFPQLVAGDVFRLARKHDVSKFAGVGRLEPISG